MDANILIVASSGRAMHEDVLAWPGAGSTFVTNRDIADLDLDLDLVCVTLEEIVGARCGRDIFSSTDHAIYNAASNFRALGVNVTLSSRADSI